MLAAAKAGEFDLLLIGYSDRWQRNLRRTLELLEDSLHPRLNSSAAMRRIPQDTLSNEAICVLRATISAGHLVASNSIPLVRAPAGGGEWEIRPYADAGAIAV